MHWDIYRGGFDRLKSQLGRIPTDDDLFDLGILRRAASGIEMNRIAWCEYMANGVFIDEGRPTLFIENPELVQIIRHARYSVKLTDLQLPVSGDSLAISYPSQLRIPPVLITLPNMREVCNGILRADGIGDGLFSHCPPDFGDWFKRMALATAEQGKSLCQSIDLSTWVGSRNVINIQCFEDEFEEIMNIDIEDDAPKEFDIVRGFHRLAIGVLVYCQAFRDSIVPGFPASMKDRNKKMAMGNSFTLGLDAQFKVPHGTHLSPRAHWRQGHFRSLRDERFKRNPDGSVRIVYVNDCIVSAGIDPYTVPT